VLPEGSAEKKNDHVMWWDIFPDVLAPHGYMNFDARKKGLDQGGAQARCMKRRQGWRCIATVPSPHMTAVF